MSDTKHSSFMVAHLKDILSNDAGLWDALRAKSA
jgi:hypothetical protein